MKTLLQQNRFLNEPAKFSTIGQLTFVEAYVHARAGPQRLCEEDRRRTCLPWRDRSKTTPPKNGEKNPGLRLRIRGLSIPAKLAVG